MNKLILIFSVFAMIVSVTVCASHVHAADTIDAEMSISIDHENSEDISIDINSCDMACAGCCVHLTTNTANEFKEFLTAWKDQLGLPITQFIVSDLIYGLKRPPKA